MFRFLGTRGSRSCFSFFNFVFGRIWIFLGIKIFEHLDTSVVVEGTDAGDWTAQLDHVEALVSRQNRTAPAEPVVTSGENDSADGTYSKSTGTHDTGLQRHIKGTTG